MNISKLMLQVLFIIAIAFAGCGKDSPTEPPIPDPVASFTYAGQAVSPAVITFQNTSQNANSYRWEFGDGDTSTVTNPIKTYTIGGTYTVRLTATNTSTGKSNSASQQINITAGPVASFNYGGQTVTPATITFQNTSQNANSYLWDFGDGSTSTQTNPSKTYTTHGTYTVKLIASNTTVGRSDSTTRQITITPGRVFIDRVYVDNIPFTDGSGVSWDLTSGPDLYFNIVDSVNTVLYTPGTYFLDLTPASLPVSWLLNPSYEITNWGRTLYIDLWDYDTPDPNDYIGYPSGFRINTVIAQSGYLTTLSLQNTAGTIRVRVILRWQ